MHEEKTSGIALFCTGPQPAPDPTKPPKLGERVVFDTPLDQAPELVRKTHAKLIEILADKPPTLTKASMQDTLPKWMVARVKSAGLLRESVAPLQSGSPAEQLFAATAIACVMDDTFDDIVNLSAPSDMSKAKRKTFRDTMLLAAKSIADESTKAYRACHAIAAKAPEALAEWRTLCKWRVEIIDG